MLVGRWRGALWEMEVGVDGIEGAWHREGELVTTFAGGRHLPPPCDVATGPPRGVCADSTATVL